MNNLQRIFGGIAWSILSNIVSAIYGFISVPLLLSYFGKEKYGLIGIALSVNVYLRILDMGFSSGNVKFFSTALVKNDRFSVNKIFQSSLLLYFLIGCLNALVLFFLYVNSKSFFNLSTNDDYVFKQLVLILVITSFGVWVGNVFEQLIRANDSIGWQQRVLLMVKIFQFSTLAITYYFHLSVFEFFLINTLCSLVNLPFYIWKIKRECKYISFTPKYDKDILRLILPYSLSIFSFGIFQFSANYLRPIIIGMKLGVSAVADYRIVEGFGNLILILSSSFLGVFLPQSAKIIALNDFQSELKIVHEATKFISIFLSIIIFGFVLFSRELIVLYVGDKYLYLVPWLIVWVISLISSHISAISSFVLAREKLKPIIYMSIFSTIFSLILSWIFVDFFQLGGVIISYTVYVLLQMTYYYVYYYPNYMKYDSRKIFFHSFAIPTSCIMICALITNLVVSTVSLNNQIISIIVKSSIFMLLVLFVVLRYLVNKSERELIFSKLPILKNRIKM